jgi:hypothetical protein
MVAEGQHVPVLSQFHSVPPGYRPDNLWKNQDAYPLVIPLAPVYQGSRRRLVPSVANLEELFANAAKPGGELKLWDVTTGRAVSTLRRGIRPIGGLAYSSDGRRLALIELLDLSGPVAVWVWDAATGRELLILRGHTDGVRDTVSPDGKRYGQHGPDDRALGRRGGHNRDRRRQDEQYAE